MEQKQIHIPSKCIWADYQDTSYSIIHTKLADTLELSNNLSHNNFQVINKVCLRNPEIFKK